MYRLLRQRFPEPMASPLGTPNCPTYESDDPRRDGLMHRRRNYCISIVFFYHLQHTPYGVMLPDWRQWNMNYIINQDAVHFAAGFVFFFIFCISTVKPINVDFRSFAIYPI